MFFDLCPILRSPILCIEREMDFEGILLIRNLVHILYGSCIKSGDQASFNLKIQSSSPKTLQPLL